MEPVTLEFEFRGRRYQDAKRGLEAVGQSLEDGLMRASNRLAKELKVYLEGVAKALAKRHGNPWPGGTTATTLSRRSGAGMKSILDSVKVTGKMIDDIQGVIGLTGYLAIHETGGTIRAKRSKYLTIPLAAALNTDGTPKRRSAREWENTFVGRSKAGNLLIFQKTATGMIPLYVLKKEVTIPARLGMKATLEAGLDYFVDRAFNAMLKEMLKGT